jgi:hypothetical protein
MSYERKTKEAGGHDVTAPDGASRLAKPPLHGFDQHCLSCNSTRYTANSEHGQQHQQLQQPYNHGIIPLEEGVQEQTLLV